MVPIIRKLGIAFTLARLVPGGGVRRRGLPAGARARAAPSFSTGGAPDVARWPSSGSTPQITIAWAKKWIGPEGGRLDFYGFAIEVPAGAVDKVTHVQHPPAGGPAGRRARGGRVRPARQQFARPVAIELPFRGTTIEAAAAPTIVWWNDGWVNMGAYRHLRRPAPAHAHRPLLDLRHHRGGSRWRHRDFRGLSSPSQRHRCVSLRSDRRRAAPASSRRGGTGGASPSAGRRRRSRSRQGLGQLQLLCHGRQADPDADDVERAIAQAEQAVAAAHQPACTKGCGRCSAASSRASRSEAARHLIALGEQQESSGRALGAHQCYRAALSLSLPLPDKGAQILALRRLGRVALALGEFQDATAYYERSADLARDTDDLRGEVIARTGVGNVLDVPGPLGRGGSSCTARRWRSRTARVRRRAAAWSGGSCSTTWATSATAWAAWTRPRSGSTWRGLDLWTGWMSPLDTAICHHQPRPPARGPGTAGRGARGVPGGP